MSARSTISTSARARLFLVIGVGVIALAIFGVSQFQRSESNRSFAQTSAGERMLTGMLDQETGLRGYALTRRDTFLGPYRTGTGDFTRAVRDARRTAENDGERRLISAQALVAAQWHRLADEEIAQLRRTGARSINTADAIARKRVFDRFRVQNARFQGSVASVRDRQSSRIGLISVAVILLLGLLFGGAGYVVIERDTRKRKARALRDRGYRQTQAEFAETLQIMRNEVEAQGLVKRHIERSIPTVAVTVLNRNNSDNRLMAATPVPEDSPLADRMKGATPETCLSVRLGRQYREGGDAEPLLACELCGKTAAQVSCVPSLVGGEVIGSVLVQSSRVLAFQEHDRVTDSVSQAAPVLANLRSLAIAETRAATDALTGLPNARSCHDTVKRMVAHAGRTLAPMSALMIDLDHFKQVNDRFGHGAGDDALAASGSTLRGTLRASDFAGRYGGEEFLVLLPDTDREGALELAEKLRRGIEAMDVPTLEAPVTASIGIATYPTDALDGDTLMRSADRALYAAKAAGRNRVEVAIEDPDAIADVPGVSPGTP